MLSDDQIDERNREALESLDRREPEEDREVEPEVEVED